ncbi:MAG: sugar-binding transcriptional regulator [Cellulosilyticum sp.]|nr:sugar-binding transcriptional regulator [Cellulosilyticum sp.]
MQNKIVDKILDLEKLLPEFTQMFKTRYITLQTILHKGPIGRRTLVQELGLSERSVRTEVEKLNEQGLIQLSTKGMTITKLGEEVLSSLYMSYHFLDEMNRLEEQITQVLGLRRAIVVKGSLEEDKEVESNLGMAFEALLKELLEDGMTLAITGGTTIAKMVEHMPTVSRTFNKTYILPARGSVGERVELHANTIAVKLAHQIGAQYETLIIPDNLSNQSIHFIKNEPQIQKILQKLAKTDIIIFGIGNAIKMARHRKEDNEVIQVLDERHAIAESFRHYFNAEGEVVYHSEVIGVSPKMAKEIPYRIAIAGGTGKARAILATKVLLEDSFLILDESAARAILKLLSK